MGLRFTLVVSSPSHELMPNGKLRYETNEPAENYCTCVYLIDLIN